MVSLPPDPAADDSGVIRPAATAGDDPRLVLRPLVLADAVELRRIHLTLEVRRWWDEPADCYEKVGFKRVGVMRRYERDVEGDSWHDGLLMELLSTDDRESSRAWDGGFVSQAIEIAEAAHRGQAYPSSESEPFIEHPLRVMAAVDGRFAKAAAVLHDVLEDTEVSVGALQDAGMPREVVDAVIAVTHTPDVSYEAYIERVAANAIARAVKLADLQDNLANNQRLAPTQEFLERIGRYERAIDRLAAVGPSPGSRPPRFGLRWALMRRSWQSCFRIWATRQRSSR